MEKHVTSEKLSDQLKAAGVPQNSEFYWYLNAGEHVHANDNFRKHESVSAFLASELGELLPFGIYPFRGFGGGWYVHIMENCPLFNKLPIETKNKYGEFRMSSLRGDTMPEAMGKMLLYLIQNKLISPPTGNEGGRGMSKKIEVNVLVFYIVLELVAIASSFFGLFIAKQWRCL